MHELVPVYTASSETEAEIIRNLLRNAGIDAQISTDDSGGMLLNLQLSEGVAVLVRKEKVREARSVLRQFQKGETGLEDEDAR